MIMRQSKAILVDAYRDLNARKMFWTVLGLNVFAMAVFALFGTNDHEMTVLWYEPFRGFLTPLDYKKFYSLGVVGVWLTWIATGLALISTAGIFPDLMASGSIDLYLAKPIGRLRLFLTKYVSGLLFVVLQVVVFTVLSFLVLGLRARLWEPGLFWAIPLVVLFFSYLYGLCALIGVLTRSTIAALLLTLLVWGAIYAVDTTDRWVSQGLYVMNMAHEAVGTQIDMIDARMASLKNSNDPNAADQLADLEARKKNLETQNERTTVPSGLVTAQWVVFDLKSFVPKTRETLSLLDRFLFQDKELQEASKIAEDDMTAMPATGRGPGGRGPAMHGPGRGRRGGLDTTLLQAKIDRDRSTWWIIGTSLLFEAACLALAAWHFCTRDF
jgi:hypothetical protein